MTHTTAHVRVDIVVMALLALTLTSVQPDSINAATMLIVRIPMDLIHVNVNLAILEMEPPVTVRKLKLPCQNTVVPP